MAPLDRLKDLQEVDDLDSALTRLFILPIAAFFFQMTDLIDAGFGVLIDPLTAFASALVDIVDQIIGGPADIVGAGVEATSGDISVLGLFAFPGSLAIALAGGFVVALFLSADITSDTLPFSFTDLPGLGVDEDEE